MLENDFTTENEEDSPQRTQRAQRRRERGDERNTEKK
jgi:hypothetical protein